METRSEEWRLSTDRGGTTRGLAVVFARSQTVLRDARVHYGPGFRLSVHGNAAFMVFRRPLPLAPGGSGVLSARYAGEPPHLVRAAWLDAEDGADGVRDVLHRVRPAGSAPRGEEVPIERLALADLHRFLASATRAATELFDARRRAIDEHACAQRFFLDLDASTHPELGTPEWAATVATVGDLLNARLATRRVAGATDRTPRFRPLEPADVFGEARALREVSSFVLEHVRACLFDDAALVDWAFELFATDRLDIPHRDPDLHGALRSHGAPNGVSFFRFAELALLCLENDVDAAAWRAHLPTLVRAAHVFAEHAVAPLTTGATYPFPPEQFRYTEGRGYPRSRLEALRAEYARLFADRPAEDRVALAEERLTSIVARALPTPGGRPAVPTRPIRVPATLLAGGVARAAT